MLWIEASHNWRLETPTHFFFTLPAMGVLTRLVGQSAQTKALEPRTLYFCLSTHKSTLPRKNAAAEIFPAPFAPSCCTAPVAGASPGPPSPGSRRRSGGRAARGRTSWWRGGPPPASAGPSASGSRTPGAESSIAEGSRTDAELESAIKPARFGESKEASAALQYRHHHCDDGFELCVQPRCPAPVPSSTLEADCWKRGWPAQNSYPPNCR